MLRNSEIYENDVIKVYNNKDEMELEVYEIEFICKLFHDFEIYDSHPIYNNGLHKQYTDRYLLVTKKQKEWFYYIYDYKGFNN